MLSSDPSVEIVKYKLPKDKKGLLAYYQDYNGKLNYYHVHSDELSPLEKWTRRMLLKVESK